MNELSDKNMIISYAFKLGKQSNILNTIRKELIYQDKLARTNGINKDGCSCGDDIDKYHNIAFEKAGIFSSLYGGNLGPQDTGVSIIRNPVPYDPNGFQPIDDLFNITQKFNYLLNK